MSDATRDVGDLHLATVVVNWFVVLRDPDGNEFCVIDSPDLGEAPDE